MSKILIMRDNTLRASKIIKQSPNYEGLFGIPQVTIENLRTDYKIYKNIPSIDLTEEYQSITNNDDELHVLAEPKHGLRINNVAVRNKSNKLIREKNIT